MILKQLTSENYWGKMPNDWNLIPIRQGFSLIGSGTTPPTGQTEFFNGSVPWITTSELRENKILSAKQTVTELAVEQFSALKIFPKDTVLIAMYGATIGRVAILGISACVNQAVCAFSKPTRFIPEFAAYTLQVSKDFLLSLVSGGGQPNLNAEKITSHLIPCPPLSQQRQIVDYLDRETSKIDALIAAKKRLLELLAEKRRSLITHAVTHGLKADVPMQDSEIESLGNIPAHWNIEHLKYHLFNIEQGWSPQSDNFPADLDEWGVLKVGAVNGWDFNSNENKRIPPELEIPLEYEIRSGDILVSRANTPELVGSASLVKEVRPKLILCDKLYRLIPQGNRLLSEYLVFYLRSSSSRFEFERDASGSSSSMQNISQGTLANLWIPIPPIDEQIQMVTYIKNKLSLIEQLETTARHAIALLQERRTSLISAAVTGQLQIAD
jgi:type I restriction enzyme, S subunit